MFVCSGGIRPTCGVNGQQNLLLHSESCCRGSSLPTKYKNYHRLHLNLAVSKISNALKRLGFRSRNFLAQLVSETWLPERFGAVSCRCHANCDEWRQMTAKAEKRR